MQIKRWSLGSILVGVASLAAAADVSPGTRLEPFGLKDQRGIERHVDQGTRLVLFSRDKDLAKMAFGLLDAKPAGILEARRACVVLDISAMPRLITWAIARPRMRRHGFPILLDSGPGPTRSLPTQDKRLTALFVDRLVVTKVAFLSGQAELEAALDLVGKGTL